MKDLTYSEWMALNGPRYERMEAQVRRALRGIIKYAACLAAEGQNDQIPKLREEVDFMAGYWFTPPLKSEHSEAQDFMDDFDRRISFAEDSGNAPTLSEEDKNDILTGLNTHITEQETDDDHGILEDYVTRYGQFYRLWRMDEQIQGMGGMKQ